MKYFKVLLIAVVMLMTFGSARAQVVVRARIGAPVHRRHYPHREVVVVRPVHHGHHWRHHHRYHHQY